MITDDTILEKLRWQRFDNKRSYRIAIQKYNDILSYVFPGLDTTKFRVQKDEIVIKPGSWGNGACFEGIRLSFWDNSEERTQFRRIEFKSTAKDFKVKVLEKFEALKTLKQEADTQDVLRKEREVADKLEITRLTQIAKRAFDKYNVTISKSMAEYRLTLEIDFSDKKELLTFCALKK